MDLKISQPVPNKHRHSHIHFMDLLRGVLMALGVLLHSAQVFNPAKNWLIHSNDSSPVAQPIVTAIHVFRMPAFFMVAGFFALLTLKKYGPNKFLRLRTERVLLPLVVTAVVVNSIQMGLLAQAGWITFQFDRYLIQGEWISHLWFLIYLFLYLTLAYAGAFVVRTRWFQRLPLEWMKHRINAMPLDAMLIALPLYQLALLAAAKFFPYMYAEWLGTLSLFDFLYYFQFFVFGLLLRGHCLFFENFASFSVNKTGAILSVWLLARIFENNSTGVLNTLLHSYGAALEVWIGCHVVFAVFKAIGDKPSFISRFTASVSYTVYLFHHVFVIAFGLLFIQLGIGGTAGVVLLTLIALVAGIGVDLALVSRYDWASFLLNGVHLEDRSYPEFTIGKLFRRNTASKGCSSDEHAAAGTARSGSHGAPPV